MILTDAQRAYTQIKDRIVTTRMPPGTVVQIGELMAELGLGRTPIREALKLLEVEQLVVVSPRRGIFVTDVTVTDLLQIHEIRMELEPLCAALVVERISPAELAEMRCLVAELDPAAGRKSQVDLLAIDRRFHALLGQACRNQILQSESARLLNLSLRIWHLYVRQMGPGDVAEDAFGEILAAIEAHDPPAAARAMRRHVIQFHESVKQAL
jgi:DNA-binding GntR family transcriptional regulator